MAGRQQTLNTTIVISGRVDNSFTRLGTGLMDLGATIDILGRHVREFTQDAIGMYAEYDDTLRAIQGKLGDASTAEMSALSDQMRAWAETTRYTATEVSGAVDEAAAAGWTLEEIYGELPDVMNLAAAANLDLVASMEYLNSGIAGMGLELSDSEKLIDQWVKTANVGRTSVEDIGKSFEALGSVMTFTSGSEELLTLLTIMGEYGTKGAEAGTLLRNVMLRLVAPTDKASAALELLGASADEISELEAADLGNAAERMEQLGLSAFDSEGNLKSIIDVVDELRKAVAGMSEDEMYDVLYDIFPTRTIRGIMDLMRSTPAEYERVMQQIVNSDGYAEWVAQLQEGGLGGALREARSKLDEFKLTYGEALADDVEMWADIGGNILSFLSDLPEDKIDALSKMAGTLAIAGPTLIGLGAATKVIGMVANPWMAAAVGISMLAVGVHELAAAADFEDMAENFGTMAIDTEALQGHVYDLGTEFRNSYSDIDAYAESLDNAVSAYETASAKLSGELLTLSLTGDKLDGVDRARLQSQAAIVHDTMLEVLEESFAGSKSYWSMLFGGEDGEGYLSIMDVLGSDYDAAVAEANAIGDGLRSALQAAFADGTISPEEYQNILAYFNDYNAAIARAEKEAQSEAAAVERRKLLMRAQTGSLSDMMAYADMMTSQRDEQLSAADDAYLTERAKLDLSYDRRIAAGTATEEDRLAALAEADAQYQQHRTGLSLGYDSELMRLWHTGLAGSSLSDSYAALMGYVNQRAAGEMTGADVYDRMWSEFGGDTTGDLSTYLARMIDSLGGFEEVAAKIDALTTAGRTGEAAQLSGLLTAERIMTGNTQYLTDEVSLQYEQLSAFVDSNPLGVQWYLPDPAAEMQTFLNNMQALANGQPVTITTRIRNATITRDLSEYAEGGRATEASIFGEAGAEWAIPEAHTARTASLLNAARAASGFTWGELAAQTGAGTGAGSQLVYSPTIIVRDAEGVDAVLQRNKEDFRKWFEEKQLRDSMEVFV